MELRSYKNILALKTEQNNYFGFHARNLTVAELTPEAWSLMAPAPDKRNSEAQIELEAWNEEVDTAAVDAEVATNIQSLSLNIAQICNLKCTYCAAGGDGTYGSSTTKVDTALAEKQIRFFLSGAQPGQSFRIEFLGGEPLLYPQIIESLCRYSQLCAAGKDIELEFIMTTNGTLISQPVAEMLGRYKFGLTISLDGSPQINDHLRPAKSKSQSSTEMTLNGLRRLAPLSHNFLYLNVNAVFGTHHTAVNETYDFLKSLDIKWTSINFNFANNSAVSSALESERLASEIYIEEMRRLAQRLFSGRGLEGLTEIFQFRRPLSTIASQTRVQSYCAAGKSLVLADTKADLYVCNWFMNDPSEKVGHLTNIDSDKWAQFAPSLIELNRCESCWARHLCGGGCMAVHKSASGHRHSKNPNFCYRSRNLAATTIRYFAESFQETETH